MAKSVRGREEPNGLRRLSDKLSEVSRRAEFSMYLRENFEAFTKVIEKFGPRWVEIAEWAKEEGHTGEKKLPDGTLQKQSLSPDAARKAYMREKNWQEKRARSRAQAHAAKVDQTSKPQPGVRVIHEPKPEPPPETKRQEPARDDDLSAALDAGRLPQRPGKKPTGG